MVRPLRRAQGRYEILIKYVNPALRFQVSVWIILVSAHRLKV